MSDIVRIHEIYSARMTYLPFTQPLDGAAAPSAPRPRSPSPAPHAVMTAHRLRRAAALASRRRWRGGAECPLLQVLREDRPVSAGVPSAVVCESY